MMSPIAEAILVGTLAVAIIGASIVGLMVFIDWWMHKR